MSVFSNLVPSRPLQCSDRSRCTHEANGIVALPNAQEEHSAVSALYMYVWDMRWHPILYDQHSKAS